MLPACAAIIAACGGGGSSSGGVTTPDTGGGVVGGGPEVTTQDPLAHCDGSGGSMFSNVTRQLGLCYSVDDDGGPKNEMQKMGGGLALADSDKDGRFELYVAHGHGTSGKLFTFDGSRFLERADSGIEPSGMDLAGYFVDVDGDGWKDFVSAQYTGLEIFTNDRVGGFSMNPNATSIHHQRATFSMAAGDYDTDGDLDLFFAHWGTGWTDGQSEYLWQNKGAGQYADVSFRVPIRATVGSNRQESEHSFTPIFTDFDSDGDPDLLLASDFSASQVLENAVGGNTFFDLTNVEISDENGMGAAVGDYDGDGYLDWFVSSIWDPNAPSNGSGNRLYRNVDGRGTFVDATDEAGVREGEWGWGSCFADFDNDGFIDLFHTNGYQSPDRPQFLDDPSRLFMSNSDGTFTERAVELGVDHTDQGRGVVCADYNSDGRVDIFIANSGKSPTVFRNDHRNDNHYVAIDLAGVGGNPEAIGARVTVTTLFRSQIQEVYLGTAYLSQAPATLHFGLGGYDRIVAVDVVWPGPGGLTSRVEDVAADQRLEIVHPGPE